MIKFFLFIPLVVGIWVYIDAKKSGRKGLSLLIWFIATLILPILFLPLWLIVRPKSSGPPSLRKKPKQCTRCDRWFEWILTSCPYCGNKLKEGKDKKPA